MKNQLFILSSIVLAVSCDDDVVSNNKDLEQNMMDLRIYQENLGDQIKARKLEDASWLLEGMDDILLTLNKQFKNHRKLAAPFSYYYKKQLRGPVTGIREAIDDNDTAQALYHYRILVNNCNDCHIENEIDKQVKF